MEYFTDEQLGKLFFIADRAKVSRFYSVANAIFMTLLEEAFSERDRFVLSWEVDNRAEDTTYYDLLTIKWAGRSLCMPVPILKDWSAMRALRVCGLNGAITKRSEHKRSYTQPYKGLYAELWSDLFEVVNEKWSHGVEYMRGTVAIHIADDDRNMIDGGDNTKLVREIERRAGLRPRYKQIAIFRLLRRFLVRAQVLLTDIERRVYSRQQRKLAEGRQRHFATLLSNRQN